jgi:hypothetical protein
MKVTSLAASLSISLLLASKEEDRLEESATVVKEILDIPDGIPQELLDKAECVVVLPSVKKLAIGIGEATGRIVSERRGASKGAWDRRHFTGSRAETSDCSSGARSHGLLLPRDEPQRSRRSCQEQGEARRQDLPPAAGQGRRRAYGRRDASEITYSRSRGSRRPLSRLDAPATPANEIYGRS